MLLLEGPRNMAKLINAKCPNCGAILELPAKLDRAFCMHCGGKVIIAKDEVHHHGAKPAIACPECEGKGYIVCHKGEYKKVIWKWGSKMTAIAYPCGGNGKCNSNYGLVPLCKDGTCLLCKGKGSVALMKCWYCNGTGKCPICNGTGKCKFCNGEGKFKCEACNGTGFKVYQGE